MRLGFAALRVLSRPTNSSCQPLAFMGKLLETGICIEYNIILFVSENQKLGTIKGPMATTGPSRFAGNQFRRLK